MNIFLIVISVLFNASAQILLKFAMRAFGDVLKGQLTVLQIAELALKNLYLWAGLGSYALSILIWLAVLSRVEVSKAYPFLSIGYVVTLFAGYFLLAEPLSWEKLLGVGAILIGILLISHGGV